MPDPSDLITSDVATAALAAGQITLTDAQTAWLPAAITAASGAIARYCQRPFVATDYDEVAIPRAGQWDRGEPDTVLLRDFPVSTLTRISGGRATALAITNPDNATNQRATIAFTFTGDPSVSLNYTGITLTRVASGVTTTSALLFTDYVTVQSLADAINALGYGWLATTTTAYNLFPSADLFGALGPVGCLGASQSASLSIFATDLTNYGIDHATGIVTLYPEYSIGGVDDPFLWPASGADSPVGSFRMPVRLAYNAGFATIPAAVQQATCEVVKNILERLTTDSTLQSETDGAYSYTALGPMANDAITHSAKTLLAMYRRYGA